MPQNSETSMEFRRRTLTLAGMAALLVPSARADDNSGAFPNRPLRFLVPFAAGSGTDSLARQFAAQISETVKLPVVVENLAGANGMVGARQAARAEPDGNLVLIGASATHASNAALYRSLGYDPARDFSPVSLLASVPLVMVVAQSSPLTSVAQVTETARRTPGRLNFGAGNAAGRVSMEMYRTQANVEVLHVPYKSTPAVITDLLGGQVDISIVDTGVALPHLRAGKLRALAVTGRRRYKPLPDVPTMIELGYRDFEMTGWIAAYVPAHTPRAIVARLNGLFHAAAKADRVIAGVELLGMEIQTTTPEGLAEFGALETQKWARITRAAGIQAE